jgi:hypothetical protein
MQNKNEEQLLGFDSIQSQFSKLKAAKDSKLKDQEGTILNILQHKKDELKTSIKDGRPSLPLLDNMPLCLRQKAISDGE